MGAITHNGEVLQGLPGVASQVNYDNSDSRLSATQVQDAIDTLANDSSTFVGTTTQWDNLTTAQKKEYKYRLLTDDYTDASIGNLSALHTTDKSSVVGAVNEVKDGLNDLGSVITPTVGTNITLLNGGYTVIGNMVCVNLSISTADAIPVNALIATIVPPAIGDTPIIIYNANTFDIVSNGRVYANGNIVASESLDASAVYVIAGCYIKAS